MLNREIVRMNLVGLGPVLQAKVKELAGETIRAFDGDPESVPAFNEVWSIIEDIEASGRATEG